MSEPQQAAPQSENQVLNRANGLRVVAAVFSAVAFNWLSELWAPTAPVVVILALVSLGLLTMSDTSRLEASSNFSWIASIKRDGLVELALAALVAGALIGGISLIPIWPSVYYDLSSSSGDLNLPLNFSNYELGGSLAIILIATIAAYRAPSFRRQFVFLIGSIFGMALSFTYIRGQENSFIATFFGTLAVASVATIVLVAAPNMFKVFKSFIGIGNQGLDPGGITGATATSDGDHHLQSPSSEASNSLP